MPRTVKSRAPLLSPTPPAPELSGVLKRSPGGRPYRIYTVALSALPQFLEKKGFEPKLFFYFSPEKDHVLGVKEEPNELG